MLLPAARQSTKLAASGHSLFGKDISKYPNDSNSNAAQSGANQSTEQQFSHKHLQFVEISMNRKKAKQSTKQQFPSESRSCSKQGLFRRSRSFLLSALQYWFLQPARDARARVDSLIMGTQRTTLESAKLRKIQPHQRLNVENLACPDQSTSTRQIALPRFAHRQGWADISLAWRVKRSFTMASSSKSRNPKSRTATVECECTRCGPGSVHISPVTVKEHLQRDREQKLKNDVQTQGPSVSLGDFMSTRRRRQATANLPPSAPTADVDMDVPGDFDPVPSDVEMERPPSVSIHDVDMPDVSGTNGINSAAIHSQPPSVSAPPVAEPLAEVPPPVLQPRDTLAEHSPFWFWQLILLTTAWMHLHFHAPHKCCELLLKVLRNIFITLSLVTPRDDVPITLTTAFKRLGLNEDFEIRAVCPRCRRAYPQDSPADLMCSHCGVPLFNAPPSASSVPISLLASGRPKTPSKPKPVLQAPHFLPSTQIVEFLNRDGNEVACESYLTRKRVPGKLQDIQDGEVCQSLKGPDGCKFFETGADRPDPEELRIGLCFGEDGFSFTRTNDAGTHSTGAASFCVTALPHHRRYRPRNLILTELTPGPHEETADEFQRTMAATVTDLLMLYDTGIFVQTPKYPKAFSARDGELHRSESAEYAKIPEDDKAARDEYARCHGTRFFEFSRLPYFNPVRQIIIDPMHCIFLGIVKTQWLDAWIRDPPALRKRTEKHPREIDQIHDYLKAMEMPSWVARLPSQVGYASGGNLTSDEWKGMLLIICPLILPHIWAEWYPIAVNDHEKAKKSWKKKETARLNRIAAGTDTAKDRKGPAAEPKPIRMFENDPDLLMKLAACCKILLSGSIDVDSLPRAQELLEAYLAGFFELQRLAKKEGLVGLTAEEQCVAENARLILATDSDVRGTLASMTAEIEELSADLGTKFSMGISVLKDVPPIMQRDILDYYNTTYPTVPIIARNSPTTDHTQSFFLHGSTMVHSHFILDGRKITSSTSQTDASSSLIQLDAGSDRYVGQIYNILTHNQPGLEQPQRLLDVRWMKRDTEFDMSAWDPYPELEIFAWEHDKFLRRSDPGPKRIIPISAIISQACRLTVDCKEQIVDSDAESDEDEEAETSCGTVRKMWFTAGLTRDVVVV
ncbi:hypothetical protein C8R47DRAFT_1203769 [Mycena vitilis]|nr:hypothetical protein C8R47DRAFT_1203769 [Mycena vitilis]